MQVQCLIVDDFYSNVDDVRNFALQQDFSVNGNYPGHRTASFITDSAKDLIQDIIRPFAGNVIWWGDDYTGAFQYTTASDRSWIHSDYTTNWAGVLYLTPDAPISAGTGLFKLKENGLRSWKNSDHTDEENRNALHNKYSQDYTKWEMVDKIGNVYNRLVLYRGDLFHVSLDYFGDSKENGRLFQLFFFNTER
jgi:hypothetical protein